MGTVAYMSPEQARGKSVDKRSDIWAFGVVLFEMLKGERLFAAETVSDTLASVLKEDIPWATLPASVPPGMVHLLKRCLARDPLHRLRDIGEARFALAATGFEEPPANTTAAALPTAPPPPRLRMAVLAACLLAGVVMGVLVSRRFALAPTRADRPARSLILSTERRGLLDSQAISPDGRLVAYTAGDSLWLAGIYCRQG